MPNRPSNAAAWYYEDFLPTVQNDQIYENQPKDWARLRIWDGNALKPALPEGFAGKPSEEQMQAMFDAMKQGNLFLFKLGETEPVQYHYNNMTKRPLDPQAPEPLAPAPQEPTAPEVPNPSELEGGRGDLTDQQVLDYSQQWENYNNQRNQWSIETNRYNARQNQYNADQKNYDENKAFLDARGEGFVNSVNQFNQEREAGMEQEQKLRAVRVSNANHVRFQRKRESMDEVIDQVMGPRPVASPRAFFGGDSSAQGEPHASNSDASFNYTVMDEELEATGYDLPKNDKLNEHDAATIQFALLAAADHMKQFTLDKMEVGGPVLSYSNAMDGFNMMMTSMFGKSRKHQPGTPYLGEARRLGKDVIGKYIEGDPKPLGEQLADSLRSIAISFAGYGVTQLTADTVAASRVVERVLDLLDTHEDLKAAVGLQEQELEYLRGYAKLGEVYDKYLDAGMKLNEAAGGERSLSQEEKQEILVDFAIREMIGAQLKKDIKAYEESPEFMEKAAEAAVKDEELHQAELKWLKENGYNEPGAVVMDGVMEYHKHHDFNAYTQTLNSTLIDHSIIQWLGNPGNLERLRAQLMADPAIAKLAQKPEAELKALVESGDGIKQLTDQVEKAQDVVSNASAWYENLKTQMLGGRPENDLNAISPWLNANVASDADRLMIAVTNEDGSKSLTSVASLLENGMEDLRDPSAATMELMYRNALEGNLYYYDVGKDMPMRLQADGQQTTLEQLEFHEAPTFWMRLANFLTFGYAYADIIHPQADRDPAVYDAFVQARGVRGEAAQDEAAARHDQARSSAQESIGKNTEMMMNFTTPDPGAKVTYPKYKPEELNAKMAEVQKADRHLMTKRVQEIHDFTIMTIGMMQKEDVSKAQLLDMMAKLVLVEAAKQEMALNNQKPGPISEGLENHFFANLDAMKNNKTFQKFTENISKDMVEHFLMTDGAKNMHKAIQKDMLKDAKQQTGEEKERSMEMDNNKQNEMNLF